MKSVAYTRVSTDKCEQELSLEHQAEMLTNYARQRGDDLVEIYHDKGKSGTKMKNRPDLQRMLRDAEQRKFQKIYVKDISRLFRNTLDFIQTFRKLDDLGIKLHLMDFGDTGQDMDTFTLNIFSMLAEQESRKMSKSMKAGKRVSMERGIVPNFVFGYQRKDKFTLVPDEVQAPWVKRIFDLYTEELWGQAKIAKYLFDNRVITSKKKDGLDSFNWSQVTVKHILTNQLYLGKVINHKQATKNIFTSERATIPEDQWIVTENEAFRLISDEQFAKAQEIMKRNAAAFSPIIGTQRRSEKHLFSNLIKCGECGFSYRRYTRQGKNPWWTCSKRSAYGTDRCSSQYTKVSEEWLTAALSEMFSGFIDNKSEFFALVAGKCKQAVKEFIKSTSSMDTEDVKKQLREIESKRNRVKRLAIDGLISSEEAKTEMMRLNEERNRLQTALSEVDKTETITALVQEELENFFKNFKTSDLLNMTNADIKKIIREIRVVSQDEINIYFNISEHVDGLFFPLRLAGGLPFCDSDSGMNNRT